MCRPRAAIAAVPELVEAEPEPIPGRFEAGRLAPGMLHLPTRRGVLGVATESIWWGAIGFALMVGGVAYAISPPKVPKATLGSVTEDGSVRAHEPAGRFGKVRKNKKTTANKQTFLRRIEDRWDRRRDTGQ